MLYVFHHWTSPIWAAFFWWAMLIFLLAYRLSVSSRTRYEVWWDSDLRTYRETKVKLPLLHVWEMGSSDILTRALSFVLTLVSLIFSVFTLSSELYLRNSYRLRRFYRGTVGALALLVLAHVTAVLSALISAALFFAAYASTAQEVCRIVFIVSIQLTALCDLWVYHYLNKKHPSRLCQISIWLKCSWFLVALALSLAYLGCSVNHLQISGPACEWAFEFFYPFLLLVKSWDFWPSHDKKTNHYKEEPTAEGEEEAQSDSGSVDYSPRVYTGDKDWLDFSSVTNS